MGENSTEQYYYNEKINSDGTRLSKLIQKYLAKTDDEKHDTWAWYLEKMREEYKWSKDAFYLKKTDIEAYKLYKTEKDYSPTKEIVINNFKMNKKEFDDMVEHQKSLKNYCSLIQALIKKQKQQSRYYLEQYKTITKESLEKLYCEDFDVIQAFNKETMSYDTYKRDEYILKKAELFKNNYEVLEYRIYILMDLF